LYPGGNWAISSISTGAEAIHSANTTGGASWPGKNFFTSAITSSADEAGVKNTLTWTTFAGESFKRPRVVNKVASDLGTAGVVSPPRSGTPDKYVTPPRGNTATIRMSLGGSPCVSSQ
jgi:hypothetical protein